MINANYFNSTASGGMIKLIYSDIDDGVAEAAANIIDPGTKYASAMQKQASTIFGVEYDKLAADKDHVGIHLVALGAYERYGLNRNGDGFRKVACENYHPTFVKNGHVYEHHQNKDPDKRLGDIKASAYNPTSDRIELFIHAHREKAAEHLQRREDEGTVSFSMACKVAYDTCTRCGTNRVGRNDPNQCNHVKHELGKMAEDGTITGTFNPEPQFFDISFVGRPADRIAWDLKVASGMLESSLDLANEAGLYVPDALACRSAVATRKYATLEKIAGMQRWYRDRMRPDGVKVASQHDRYLYEFRKLADVGPSDEDITELRKVDVKVAMRALANAGVMLDPVRFFKYAMGDSYATAAPYMVGIHEAVSAVFEKASERTSAGMICDDATFDVSFAYDPFGYAPTQRVASELFAKLANASVVGPASVESMIRVTIYNDFIKKAVDISRELVFNRDQTYALARKYAAYKLSAVDAIAESGRFDTDLDTIAAIAAVQNTL